MAFTTLSLGLTLTIPTNGTRNWGTTMFNTTWTKISQHAHTGSGDGNQISAAGLSDFSISKQKLSKNLALHQAATLSPVGTAQTIDFNNGNIQVLDVSGAAGTVIVTLSNPIQGAWYTIFIKQGVTFHDVTFPASVKWPQAQMPILTQSPASATDLVMLYYDGTDYKGLWELDLR